MSELIRTLFPSRYIQGPSALQALGTEAHRLGSQALLVCDDFVRARLLPSIIAALGNGIACEVAIIAGPCSPGAIESARQQARAAGSDVVIGIGGGKVMDSAKLIADSISLPLILVPSIAATDAPCSAIAVLCDEEGRLDRYVFLPRSPDLVLVDTNLILAAPARMLIAGIGDALTTWYEMEESRQQGLCNLADGAIGELPRALARHCRDLILSQALAALASQRAGEDSPAFEAVVEANILLSGLGFESGGLGSAHAIGNGLARLPGAKGALHGELVAVGLLAMLRLQGDEDEFARIAAFCAAVGLPCSLADLGLADLSAVELSSAANYAATPAVMNRMPARYTPDRVCAALRQL